MLSLASLIPDDSPDQPHCSYCSPDLSSQIRNLVRAELRDSMSDGILYELKTEVKADLLAELTGKKDLRLDVRESRSCCSLVTGNGAHVIGKSTEARAPMTDLVHTLSAPHVHDVPTQTFSDAKITSQHHRQNARVHLILEALSQRITDLDTTINERIALLHDTMRSGDSAIIASAMLQEVTISSHVGSQMGLPEDASGVRRFDYDKNELTAEDICYDLHETMWDVLVFCKVGVFSFADAWCVTLIVFLNIAVQGCFIGLVASTMLDHDLSDTDIVTTLRDWRIVYAHNPDFADTFTDEPLAKNICRRSVFRMQGASQAALYNDLDDYTQSFLMVPSGGVVCLLSVFVWTLTCAKEFQRAVLFLIGIWTPNDASLGLFKQRPFGSSFITILDRSMSWVHGDLKQKKYQIFITRRRALTMTIVVVLPRVIVLMSLFFVGCLFLVRTVELADLILNAVALEVIMDADEMLFSAFAPFTAIRLIRKTMPLRVPRLANSAEHTAPWIKLVVVSVVLFLVGTIYLAPMINIMIDSKNAMCDGDLEFLAVQMPFGAVVAARPTSAGIDRNSHKYRAIYQRTNLEISTNGQDRLYIHGGAFALTGPNQVLQMKEWRDRTIRDTANLDTSNAQFFECDQLGHLVAPWQEFAFRSGIGSFVGVQNLSSCKNVLHLCFNDSSLQGKIARFVCPDTCGVNRPLSGLYMDTADDGALDDCRRDQIEDLWGIHRCSDAQLNDFQRFPAFRRYAEGFAAVWKGVFIRWCTVNGWINQTHVKVLTNWLWQGMLAHGCGFFARRVYFPGYDPDDPWIDSINFCDPFDRDMKGRRTVRVFCPEACKCNNLALQPYKHIIPILPFYVLEVTRCPGECLRQVAGWWPKTGF